jgi:demethylspheroidene O-methyltransferase
MPPEVLPAPAAFLPVGRQRRSLFSLASIVAKPGFRRWAARFFLTRPVARRQTAALFDICAGFVYAQILQACLELGAFKILAQGPVTTEGFATRTGLPVAGAQRLLDGAVALKLVARTRGGGAYALATLGAALVDNEAIAAMVAHHRLFYADMADPVALLRGGKPTTLGEYWAYAGTATPAAAEGQAVAPYTALMAASQQLVADEILDSYAVGRHRCLMDVGGGNGSFLIAAAKRAPNLRLRLFDLPAVAELATPRFAQAGLQTRAQVFGGSFLHDPLPTGADLISLVRVAHDHDDDRVLTLFRAVHDALPRDGRLLLAEPMADTPGATRMGDA